MKKFFYSLLALAFSACGSGNKDVSSESDSIAEEEIDEAVEAVRNSMTLTKDSIGMVRIGAPMNLLPDSMPGFYTKKEIWESPDAVSYVFSNDDGQQFVTYDFGEGNIDVINLIGTDVFVKVPDGELRLGSAFNEVLALPGVVAEWSSYDDNGMWYWKWNGLWFAPTQEDLPAGLSAKLYSSAKAPAAEDFTKDVTIGFIGTGLPF